VIQPSRDPCRAQRGHLWLSSLRFSVPQRALRLDYSACPFFPCTPRRPTTRNPRCLCASVCR